MRGICLCLILLVVPCAVSAQIRFPKGPLTAAAREGTTWAFIADRDDNLISIVTGSSSPYTFRTIETSAPAPFLVVSPAQWLYVLDPYTPSVTAINPATGATLAECLTGLGTNPQHIAATSNVIVVLNTGENTISTFPELFASATKRTVGYGPKAIAILNGAGGGAPNTLFVLNALSKSVTRLNDVAWTTSTYAFTDAGSLTDIAVSQDTGRVYVTDTGLNKLYILDGTATPMTLEETFDTCAYPTEAAINDSRDRIYILCQNSDNIAALAHGAAPEYTHTHLLTHAVGSKPIQMAVFDDDSLADRDQIYVISELGKTMTVFDDPDTADPQTPNFTTATLNLSFAPTQMAVRTGDTPADVRIFVTHHNDSAVSIVTPNFPAAPSATTITYPGEAFDMVQYRVGGANKLFLSHPQANELSIVDLTTSEMIFSPFCAGASTCTYPTKLGILPTIDRLYALNTRSSNVEVVNTTTNAHVATTAVGNEPIDIATDVTRSRAFILNHSGESVSVLNTGTNAIVRTDTVGDDPTVIAYNASSRKIYVANTGDNTVSVINDVAATAATVAVGNSPIDFAIDETNNLAYVANYNSNSISIIDDTDSVAGTVTLNVTPRYLLLDSALQLLFIASPSQNKITILNAADPDYAAVETHTFSEQPYRLFEDTATNTIYTLFPYNNLIRAILPVNYGLTEIPTGFAPERVAIDTSTVPSTVHVLNKKCQTVTTYSGALPDLNDLPQRNIPIAYVADANDKVYVINRGSRILSIIDATPVPPDTPALVEQKSLCLAPVAIAAHTTRNRIFVACQDSAQVAVFNALTNAFIGFIPVGDKPRTLLVNEAADKLYVANSGSNTVSIFNTATDAFAELVSSPVTVGTRPVSLALNTVTNGVTVANLASNSYSIIASNQAVTTTAMTGSYSPFKVVINSTLNPQETFIANLNRGILYANGLLFTPTGTLSDLKNPTGMALNSTTGKLYLTFLFENKMRIYNEGADTVKDVSTGDGPFDIAIAETAAKIYVLNQDAETISVFDNAEVLSSTLTLPANSRPCGLFVYEAAGDNDWLFVSLCGTDQIAAVRIDTDAIAGLIGLN